MINLLKTTLFSLAIVMFSYSNANAVTLSGLSADAEVVEPLAITEVDSLNFGTFDNLGGTVVVVPSDDSLSTTGSLEHFGDNKRAEFTVTGAPGESYSTTVPSSITLTGPGASTMSASLTSSNTGTLTAGTDSLYVGGTLTVASGQAVGTYAATYAITIIY